MSDYFPPVYGDSGPDAYLIGSAGDEVETSRNRSIDADRQAALGGKSDVIEQADADGGVHNSYSADRHSRH